MAEETKPDLINGRIVGADFHDGRCANGEMVMLIAVKQRSVHVQHCEIRLLTEKERIERQVERELPGGPDEDKRPWENADLGPQHVNRTT